MSKIQQMFSANGRALFPDEIPLVEAFNAKYADQLNPPGPAVTAQACSATRNTVPPLLPLSAFHAALPGLNWRVVQPATALSLRECERVVLQFQQANVPLGHQLWREEELGRQGIFTAEEDSRQFAQALVEALGDRLSLCDLEQLAAAFAAKLASAQASRQAAIEAQAALEQAAKAATPDHGASATQA